MSDRPPSIRTETYAQDILDKLRFCVEHASEHADVMVLLGDVFHIKSPSRTSHELVQATADVLAGFRPRHQDRGHGAGRSPGRVLIVPGNHDLSQDRLESLPGQPLGTLALSPNVELLTGYDEETGIFGIPYLSDWSTLPRWLDDAAGCELIATHAPIFPPGEDPPFDYIPAQTWAAMTHTSAPIAYGHIHDPHGFYEVDGRWFCNNGAISRGSLHEKTVKRHPRVTIFDSDIDPGNPFTSVDVPFKPADQVFRLTEHVEHLAREERLDTFLAGLDDVALASLSLEEVVAHAATSGLSSDAQRELADIVESAVHQA